MKVCDIIEKLGLTVFSGEQGLDREITGGYTSDLLSDVMGNSEEGQVWITLQTHKNVMAVASLKDVAAIIIVKGFQPEEGTINQSNDEDIPLLGTDMEAFEVSGRLYELLNN
ncbi:serine kinase [Marinilabiliaceae bacterium JC017]|nr:serine kinase [Marinilabiliaceae bacterium JC017]